MNKLIMLCLCVFIMGCARYVEISDVEFAVHVTFDNNAPVFKTKYTVTVMNDSVDTVIQEYEAMVHIVDEHKNVIKPLSVSIDRLLPKQIKQVVIDDNENEQAVKPLFHELEIEIDEVIKQQGAALILPSSMVVIKGQKYESENIVEYLKR